MKATILFISGRYEATGLHDLGNGKYEMRYIHSIGSRSYKTAANCKKAIEKHGFEYVEVSRDQITVAYD